MPRQRLQPGERSGSCVLDTAAPFLRCAFRFPCRRYDPDHRESLLNPGKETAKRALQTLNNLRLSANVAGARRAACAHWLPPTASHCHPCSGPLLACMHAPLCRPPACGPPPALPPRPPFPAGNCVLQVLHSDVVETLQLLTMRHLAQQHTQQAQLGSPPAHRQEQQQALEPLAQLLQRAGQDWRDRADHIQASLEGGGACDKCGSLVRVLCVTPCACLLCVDCASPDQDPPRACIRCGEAFRMQVGPAPPCPALHCERACTAARPGPGLPPWPRPLMLSLPATPTAAGGRP